MDLAALWKVSYGMYALCVKDGETPTGCIINTVMQVTSDNPTLAISLNKKNYTYEVIQRTKKFSLSILSEKSNPNIIARLGFACGRTMKKFEGGFFEWKELDGLPVIKGNCCGHIICEVLNVFDVDTHSIILARIKDTKTCTEYPPMTYTYYHDVIKGKAPKTAPTYQAPVAKKDAWVCSICGYVYDGDLTKEPDTWVCPICKKPKSVFVKKV